MSLKLFALDWAEKLWLHCPRSLRHRILRASQDNFLIGTLGIIENSKSEILLLEHRFRLPSPWGLPGGFLQRHESPQEGLIRELREETGLEITLNPGIYEVIHEPTIGNATLIMTGKTVEKGLRLSSEIRTGGFYSHTAVPPQTYEPHLELIDRWFQERE